MQIPTIPTVSGLYETTVCRLDKQLEFQMLLSYRKAFALPDQIRIFRSSELVVDFLKVITYIF